MPYQSIKIDVGKQMPSTLIKTMAGPWQDERHRASCTAGCENLIHIFARRLSIVFFFDSFPVNLRPSAPNPGSNIRLNNLLYPRFHLLRHHLTVICILHQLPFFALVLVQEQHDSRMQNPCGIPPSSMTILAPPVAPLLLISSSLVRSATQ